MTNELSGQRQAVTSLRGAEPCKADKKYEERQIPMLTGLEPSLQHCFNELAQLGDTLDKIERWSYPVLGTIGGAIAGVGAAASNYSLEKGLGVVLIGIAAGAGIAAAGSGVRYLLSRYCG